MRLVMSLMVLFFILSINHSEHVGMKIPLTDDTIITMDTLVVSVEGFHPSVADFMRIVAEIESNGRYNIKNKYGMLGRYQFSPVTIRDLGFRVSSRDFLRNPQLQDSVMYTYMKYNEKYLLKLINVVDGHTINGVKLNRATVLAGAHFAGTTGMKRYLMSWGKRTTTDAFGTSLQHYMSRFSDVDLPVLTDDS